MLLLAPIHPVFGPVHREWWCAFFGTAGLTFSCFFELDDMAAIQDAGMQKFCSHPCD